METIMHQGAYRIMERFAGKYLSKDNRLKILDVGSFDVNGTYRPIFDNPEWEYVGLDIVPGSNVDIISKTPYDFGIQKETYDVVVSGSTMEHVEAVWVWVKQLAFVLKQGGMLCVTAPTRIHIHRHPVDCWRIMPDGMRYLIGQCAGMDVLECEVDPKSEALDIFCVARKGQ
jgi:SAM-dependent methyltransferase